MAIMYFYSSRFFVELSCGYLSDGCSRQKFIYNASSMNEQPKGKRLVSQITHIMMTPN